MLIKDEFLRAAIARTLQLKEEEIDEKAMERLVSSICSKCRHYIIRGTGYSL